MARITQRKLFLFGRYSLALLPPKKWLAELGIKAGDTVQLEFDRARKRIVVRLTAATDVASTKTRKSKKPNNQSDPDWQPIPQL